MRVEGAEQGEHLPPEAGQPRQAQRGDRGEGEQSAEPGSLAVQGVAGLLGEGVEVGGAGALLERADHEEEQAGDQAVGDVGEEGAVDAGRCHGRDAEQDEAHVADGGVGDEALEVALRASPGKGQAGQGAVDDADDGEGGEVGREGAEAVRGHRQQDADEPVRTHLEQDAGQQDRADGRRGGVGVGQPAVQRPHRGLHREPDPDRQNGGDLHGRGQRPAVVSGECHHVESARLDPDQEQAEQHDDGAEEREEDELPGGPGPSRAAPAGDEEVHRDEDRLEGEEEEDQVEDGEGGEGAGLEDEQQRDERLRARTGGPRRRLVSLLGVRVERAEEGQQRGQDQEGEGDAVDAEVDAHVECGDPADVRARLHPRRVVVVEAEDEDDRGGEDRAGDGDAVPQHGLVGRLPLQSGRGRQKGGDGTEERADDEEREKDPHHGLVDIDHACSRSRGDEDGGDREDDGAGEQRAHIGLHIAGLGTSYGGPEPVSYTPL